LQLQNPIRLSRLISVAGDGLAKFYYRKEIAMKKRTRSAETLRRLDEDSFHPGLLELEVGYGKPEDRVISICLTDGPCVGKGTVIARLIPSERLTQRAAIQLAEFFSYAPQMWELLREDTAQRLGSLKERGEPAEEGLSVRLDVLSDSAGREPFDMPLKQTDDDLYRERMKAVLQDHPLPKRKTRVA
jgi:hypothetical protein